MTNLYGKVWGDRGEVTKASTHDITAWVQTHTGRIMVTLDKYGNYRVSRCAVYNDIAQGRVELLASGTVNDIERETGE